MQGDRQRQITRTHWLGVGGNALLAVLKLGVGGLAGSRALIADGVHSSSDVAMNLGAWLGWRWSAKPRDRDHHYGHGNGEALTAVGIGLIVVAAGVGLGWMALRGRSSVGPDALGVAAVSVELLSMVLKFGLARVTASRGRELDSPILVALSRDNLADVLTSGLVLLAITGAIFGLRWLEPLAAGVVGAVIVWHGLISAYEGLGVLMDRAPDHALTAQIVETAAGVPGVCSVDDVRVHPLGTHLRADLEVGIDGTITVAQGHEIAHAVERAVTRTCARVEEVAVHVNPASHSNAAPGSDPSVRA
ncbi:Cobalt-zinc-cadmium resistance protein [Enhygromyxa salina]|uniref:Cobalt-zinc-cadmium resistance protein n=1 Tax=Enhygromyxa salina TaxID=215803 RepID=A0A0C2D0T1_9BACT|nr:cation diffusion facilitator family transporter [Enhygromyxa salina]KIG15455.1 Cobalt-zinc-cadmium resistance protein [Enhygromyxa salina]